MFSHYIFWPWFAGLVFFIMGLISVRDEFVAAHRLDKIIVFGRIFAASALAAFGAEHMLNIRPFPAAFRATYPFIPSGSSSSDSPSSPRPEPLLEPLYEALLDAARRHVPLRASAAPSRRRRQSTRPHPLGGRPARNFFCRRIPRLRRLSPPRSNPLILIGRFGAAIPYLFFAVMNILHPQNAPGVPLPKLSPPWLFWPHVWATITALFLAVAGVAVLLKWKARIATALLGLWMVLLILVVYLPLFIPARDGMQFIEAVNYTFDTMLFAGTSCSSPQPCRKTNRPGFLNPA